MWELKTYRYFSLVIFAHIALVYVLVTGSALQIAATIFLHILNIWIAGTVTYHRLISHRSWDAPRWFEIFGTLLGVFSFTGTSVTRTIVHRQHHAFPDTKRDPHSPWINSWWKQYFPMLAYKGPLLLSLGKDVYSDPFHRWVHHHYLLIILISCITSYFLIGFDWTLATLVAPGALSWITIFLGNTLCHLGKDETNRACDNWFIVLIGFGEGWHGFHHRHPKEPNFGQGKFDPGWWLISKLKNR
jgi:stearoyl-CoA desaturase (delta-9 desaturase)